MMLKRPEKTVECGVWRSPGHFCVETIFIYNGFYKVVILISGRLPAGSKLEQHITYFWVLTNQEKPSTALKLASKQKFPPRINRYKSLYFLCCLK